MLARQAITQGTTILTEPPTLCHCDVDQACDNLSDINRANSMKGAYRQLLRQVAASLFIQSDSDAPPPNSQSVARRRFEQLHSVSESAFLAHHASIGEQTRAESLRVVSMAKEVFVQFQSACGSSSPTSSSESPSPSSPSAALKLCATETDFVLALIRFKLNAWSFAVPALSQTRINIVPHIAAANHACCPNSVVVEGRRIVALRDIAQHEPITLSYLGLAALRSLDTPERRRRLWKDWMFHCECDRCITSAERPTQRNWDHELVELECTASNLAPAATTNSDGACSSEEDEKN